MYLCVILLNLLTYSQNTPKLSKEIGNTEDWLLVHRVDLHNLLREAVEKQQGTEIILSARISAVAGKITKLHLFMCNANDVR